MLSNHNPAVGFNKFIERIGLYPPANSAHQKMYYGHLRSYDDVLADARSLKDLTDLMYLMLDDSIFPDSTTIATVMTKLIEFRHLGMAISLHKVASQKRITSTDTYRAILKGICSTTNPNPDMVTGLLCECRKAGFINRDMYTLAIDTLAKSNHPNTSLAHDLLIEARIDIKSSISDARPSYDLRELSFGSAYFLLQAEFFKLLSSNERNIELCIIYTKTSAAPSSFNPSTVRDAIDKLFKNFEKHLSAVQEIRDNTAYIYVQLSKPVPVRRILRAPLQRPSQRPSVPSDTAQPPLPMQQLLNPEYGKFAAAVRFSVFAPVEMTGSNIQISDVAALADKLSCDVL